MKHLILWMLGLLLSTGVGFADPSKPAATGHPNRGLKSRIQMTGRQFAPAEPILVSYSVKNVAQTVTTVWNSGFWPNHQIRVCDQNGKLAALREFGKERFNAFDPGGERAKNFPVELKPGAEDKLGDGLQDLARLYDLTSPGIYSVQVLYEEYQGGWEGRLWSNVIIIQIVP